MRHPFTDRPPFLEARWLRVVLLNYEVDPDILEPLVPRGTALNLHDGRCYVSLVGFRFLEPRVLGVDVPFHREFPEVNLRFYVRRLVDGEERRGVVFVKEAVPRPAIALAARLTFNENYVTLPMWNEDGGRDVQYGWTDHGSRQRMGITVGGPSFVPQDGTSEHFLVENHWGWSKQRDGSTLEYRVEHRPWHVWRGTDYVLESDVESFLGRDFVPFLRRPPASALLADGSEVVLRQPDRITADESGLVERWPFEDAQNVAVFTVSGIVREGHPVLRVTHDSADGAWQFLECDTPVAGDAMVVGLAEMTRLDPSLLELADLPAGWRAHRRSGAEPWHREPNPDPEA